MSLKTYQMEERPDRVVQTETEFCNDGDQVPSP